MYLGPDEILLVAALDFKDGTTAQQVQDVSTDILARLREVEPRIAKLFLRADRN
jgi:hypothetical protein